MTIRSPRRLARITGAIYLLTIVAGIYAQSFISGKLVVASDAAATAANITAHKPLYQLGLTIYLIEMAGNIAITALFYELLRPVSKTISLLSAFFGLAGCTIKTLSRIFYLAPLLVLDLTAFRADQLQQLALLFWKINDHGAAIGLVFLGLSTVFKGWLIARSTFLPRILGILSILAGLGWLTFIYPSVGYRLFPYVALIGLVGAAAQIFWLLVYGVNEQRWRDQP